jgi:hypothetical protein
MKDTEELCKKLKAMDYTTFYIVVFVVIAHFVVGIGFLVYKIGGFGKKSNPDDTLNEEVKDEGINS